jgi:NADH dehydrogenase
MVQISAIGADANGTAQYARTKAEAERRVLAAQPGAVIMRPSIVFGPEDDFFNRFASLARMLPALPLIGGGHTKFQPVFAGDVAQAIADAVDGKAQAGATYELGGPSVYSFRQLMEFVLTTTGRKRMLMPLPFAIAKLEASLLQFLPKPLLTPDQVELLRTDNVVSEEAIRDGRTLKAFGIAPESIESIVPTYLWRFRKTGQFYGRTA